MFHHFLRKLLSWTSMTRSKRQAARPRPKAVRLAVERLEDRWVPSGAPFAAALGGPGVDVGWSVATDNAGNVYVAGQFEGARAEFPGLTHAEHLSSHGGSDGFIAKYSSVGDIQWIRQIGGAFDDAAKGVAVTSDGQVYVTGFRGLSATSSEAFVIKYNTNGIVQWDDSL